MSDQQPQTSEQPTPDATDAEKRAKAPVIESASATTSPDNNSGKWPYVLVAVVLAALVALSLALANAAQVIGTAIAEDYSGYDGYGYNERDDSNGYDDFEDFLDDLDGNGATDHDLTSDNVFDEDLSCYDYSIDDYVFASDYSGSQQAVSDYVKTLTKADATATSSLASHLRAAAAASDDATRADELSQAAQISQQAAEDIKAIELPSGDAISGSKAASIVDDLTSGRDAALTRWKKIGERVELLQSPEGHTSGERADLDTAASRVTDAAVDLTDALSDSANYK